jgi:hypothetical protein
VIKNELCGPSNCGGWAGGDFLPPRETATAMLEFLDPSGGEFDYDTRVPSVKLVL